MSHITLKPLDDGQKAVEIPLGKTTIGRGTFLGCNDKKVSRNHAVLEVTSKGEVFLTPTHVNPCFYQPTVESPGQILKKDVPHKLENGDSFSLLPRAYRYQLIVEGETSHSETSDQNDKQQCTKTNGSVTSDLLNDGATTNEELGDTSNTIVPEKPFNKEENVSVEKGSPKEENTFSKKIAEIKDNNSHDLPETNEESEHPVNGKEPPVAEPPPLPECKESPKRGEKTESTINSSGEEVADIKGKSPVTKVVDENDSTPDLDSAPKSEAEEEEEVTTTKEPASLPEEKVSEREPDSAPEPDVEDSNDQPLNEEPIVAPEEPAKPGRKKGSLITTIKKPPRKGRQPKREGSPKPRGRKKKVNLDDSQEGTSRTPGRTSSRTNRQTRQGLSLEDFIVSDDDEWQSDRSDPKPRRKRGRRRGDDSGSDWEVEHKKPKKPLLKVWSGSDSGNEQYGQKKKKGPKGRRRKEKSTEEVNEVMSEEEEEEPLPSSSAEIKLRIPCTYGKKCYRRSTNHKEQFSHPGDSDYNSDQKPSNDAISESEDDAPKKECPYGANCFRKNPQHKKDFKHTKKLRPQREAAKQADKKAKNSRNSEEVDSYDLNDSFLNDDSEDEYKPVDSGSDFESGEKVKKLKGKRGKGGGKKL